jgi:hypothetical protein
MDSPGVRERIAELKGANSRKATLSRGANHRVPLQRDQDLRRKSRRGSPLVQSAEFVDGKPVKLRIPDKIAAVKRLGHVLIGVDEGSSESSCRPRSAFGPPIQSLLE